MLFLKTEISTRSVATTTHHSCVSVNHFISPHHPTTIQNYSPFCYPRPDRLPWSKAAYNLCRSPTPSRHPHAKAAAPLKSRCLSIPSKLTTVPLLLPRAAVVAQNCAALEVRCGVLVRLRFAAIYTRFNEDFTHSGAVNIAAARHSSVASVVAASLKTSKMTHIPPTPQVNKLDPKDIPIVGLQVADNIKITVNKCACSGKGTSDILVFLVYGQKSKSCAEADDTPVRFILPADAADIDARIGQNLLRAAVEDSDFDGKIGSTVGVRLPTSESQTLSRLYLLGLGAVEDMKPVTAAKAGSALAALLTKDGNEKVQHASVVWPPVPSHHCAEESIFASAFQDRLLISFMESMLLGLQPDHRFKGLCKKDKASQLKHLTLYVGEGHTCDVEKILRVAQCVAKGVYFAQELVNAPPNFCTTVALARAAKDMAKQVGLELQVLSQDALEKFGMGCYLAVNKGSMYPPMFIQLSYRPSKCGLTSSGLGDEEADTGPTEGNCEGLQGAAVGGSGKLKRIVLVGKGVCFDSGGLNIKSAASQIELMKFDMAGGAAVIGALYVIAQLKPKGVEVFGLVPACENFIDSRAYRPGDVVTAANGRTVEVGNTDAEGRLSLADALVYAEKVLKPDAIVDIATLTGAIVVALGSKVAGLFSNDKCLARTLLEAANCSGEELWHMPLVKEYLEALESKIADLNNVGGKGKGGSITAAVFLDQFVSTTPWAHLDIAGTAWDYKGSKATGYGVRTLVEFVSHFTQQHLSQSPE